MATPKPLTARELELAGLVWQCFDSEPKVNYQKFCEVGGFKNTASACTVWLSLKKKLMAHANGATKATPKSAGKRKKEAALNDTEAPSNKKPRTPAKAKAPLANEEEVEADNDSLSGGEMGDY